MRNSDIAIRPLTGGVGAEIDNVDLSRLDAAGAEVIRRTLFDRGVVFFRHQHLTPEQHIAAAERFGPININRFFKHVDGYPMIAEVRKEPEQRTNIGGGWHADHSYDRVPALGSMLYAREVPQSGGDTMFASMYAAYDALPRVRSIPRRAARAAFEPSRLQCPQPAPEGQRSACGRIGNSDLATQDAVHPVVVRHPGSDRPALYINPGFTLRFEGWTEEESRPLLDYLYRHAVRPEFCCRFQWEEGSLAFWDNRATWHYAVNDYHGERRLMHRITVEGSPLS
jgi:taurine dioxygenase